MCLSFLNVPVSIPGILAPILRMGAKLNHLLCSHCLDSSEIYTVLAKYPCVRKREKSCPFLSVTFSFSVKQLFFLITFFFFYTLSLCNMNVLFFGFFFFSFSLPECHFLSHLAISCWLIGKLA